jgi:AAA family ATP:ADP antiporter
MWTYKLNLIFTSSKSLNCYISRISLATGLIATIAAFIISGNVIRKYGWTVAGLITPIVWIFASLFFFFFLIYEDIFTMEFLYNFLGNPCNFILFFGSVQMCLGRSCKYTVFDETKEIAFIPMSKENQRKSKAVVDGIASRFGKSGGSIVYIWLLFLLGDMAFTITYVSIIIFIVMFFWIIAVLMLGKLLSKSIDSE